MLSHFLKNFVSQKDLAYYEVSLDQITIATLGDEGLEKALRVISRVANSGRSPDSLEHSPSLPPMEDSSPAIPFCTDNISADSHAQCTPSGSVIQTSEPVILDSPRCSREHRNFTGQTSFGETNDLSSNHLFQAVTAQVQRTIEASEERMKAKVEQLIEATKPDGDCLLSEAKKDFMAKDSHKRKHAKTVREYHFFFKSFIDIVGDKKLSEYRYLDASAYAEALRLLPKYPHLNRAFDNCNYKEMIEVGKTINAPTIGLSTQQHHIKTFKAVFHWLADKFNLRRDASEGVDMLQYVRDEDQSGQPFSSDELKRIFDHALVLKYKSPDQYWAPMFSLHTGMRVNEIAQLYVSDFVEEEVFDAATQEIKKVWCVKIQLDNEKKKSLKSRNAKRTIPLPKVLIDLGLLKYLDDLRARGLKHFLPGLKWGENGPGGEISAWFNEGYLHNKCGILDDTKSFHSFRNGFETIADRSSVDETALIRLCGYGRGLTVWRVHYIKDATLDECYAAIQKMNFPKLDFMPYHWRQYKDYLDDVEKKATPEERIPVVIRRPRGRPPKYAALPRVLRVSLASPFNDD